MNDEELMTLVREQRTTLPMATSVEEIITRGHSVRDKRRVSRVTTAIAGAGAAAAVVMALGPVSHQAQPGTVRLAAWTVTKQAGGEVTVTIRELQNRTQLADALHADGVPAYVAFAGPVPEKCQVYPVTQARERAMYQFRQGNRDAVLTINPSAFPAGTGLFIMDVPATPTSSRAMPVVAGRAVHVGVVSASGECRLDGAGPQH